MHISGYREQNGCHNCLNVIMESDYDSPTNYFCNHDCSLDKRKWYKPLYKKSRNDYAILGEWRNTHHVSDWGICKFYKSHELGFCPKSPDGRHSFHQDTENFNVVFDCSYCGQRK